MSGAAGRYTILESWPMIREDFEAFTKDPTQWFADQFEQAARKKDWEAANKLIDIFKLVNSPAETHHSH
jgi:hypothetical protein